MTRILVVDDDPQILRALATNLRTRGCEVDLAQTGEAGLILAARKHSDLVVLDLGLSGIGVGSLRRAAPRASLATVPRWLRFPV